MWTPPSPSIRSTPLSTTGTDQTTLVKIGGQWTHLFGTSVEANINGGWVHAFGTRSGIVATVTGHGTDGAHDGQPELVRIWRPARLPHLTRDGSPTSSSTAPPAPNRSATRSMAAWDCGSVIRRTGARGRGRDIHPHHFPMVAVGILKTAAIHETVILLRARARRRRPRLVPWRPYRPQPRGYRMTGRSGPGWSPWRRRSSSR